MIELALRFHRRARIWLGDCSALLHSPAAMLGENSSGNVEPTSPQVAVELLIPRGGDVQYGLLGATFTVGGSDSWKVFACIDAAEETGRAFDGLISWLETPRIGLPPFLATELFSAALERSLKGQGMVAGSLLFNQSVHSRISSSQAHYRLLAQAVMTIMALDDPVEERLEAELESLLAEQS